MSASTLIAEKTTVRTERARAQSLNLSVHKLVVCVLESDGCVLLHQRRMLQVGG